MSINITLNFFNFFPKRGIKAGLHLKGFRSTCAQKIRFYCFLEMKSACSCQAAVPILVHVPIKIGSFPGQYGFRHKPGGRYNRKNEL